MTAQAERPHSTPAHSGALQTEEAASAVQHVNEDHQPELLLCVRAFTTIPEPTGAQLSALFVHGMQVSVTSGANHDSVFIPYSVNGPAHEAIRATVMAAMNKLGLLPEQRLAQWQVSETRVLTPQFRRLILDLGEDTRSD